MNKYRYTDTIDDTIKRIESILMYDLQNTILTAGEIKSLEKALKHLKIASGIIHELY